MVNIYFMLKILLFIFIFIILVSCNNKHKYSYTHHYPYKTYYHGYNLGNKNYKKYIIKWKKN